METGKHKTSVSEERRSADKGRMMTKSAILDEKKVKDVKEHHQMKSKYKPSQIPIPKGDKIEPRLYDKQRKCFSSTKICCNPSKVDKRYENFDNKLKLLEEKERSVAQFYLKIEELLRKLSDMDTKESGNQLKNKISRHSEARKMTSDSVMMNKHKTNNDILSDLENNVHQISKIWLQASTDLSSTLKNLKSNPSLDPMEFELEKVRLQLAIKQTKSLTLVKTRDILAEAKKLFRHREMIRTELENIINYENVKLDKLEHCECLREESNKNLVEQSTNTSFESELKISQTGDQPIESTNTSLEIELKISQTGDSHNATHQEVNLTPAESIGKDVEEIEEESAVKSLTNPEIDKSEEEKVKSSEEKPKKQTQGDKSRRLSHKKTDENLAKEISKKNETIACLNNKIFELQKTCTEQSEKCAELKVSLCHNTDKVQWNHVLWKQINKLKEQIKGLQQSNKQLESQKRDLECRITKQELEVDRLIKLNHFLNQKKYLMNSPEKLAPNGESKRADEPIKPKSEKSIKESERKIEEIILAEKQSAIKQLRNILNVMIEQENFAQKQILIFQAKIEELEKSTKA